LPFLDERCGSALTSLDFLGLEFSAGHAFTGELLSQGRPISMRGGFPCPRGVLVITLLLTFMGDALRDAWILERCRHDNAFDFAIAPEPLLEVRQLHVSFGGKDVVHGIDLSIAPGENLPC
jgi:hypothetical protein